MLRSMRNFTGSWSFKVLIALLVLSFGAWGVGDMFTGRASGGAYAVKVGDVEVSAAEVRRDFRAQSSRFGQLAENEMIRNNIMSMVISQSARRAALDMAAKDLGIGVTDAELRASIMASKEFQDENGTFNKNIFLTMLSRANYNEDSYMTMLRGELTRGLIGEAVFQATQPPKTLINEMYKQNAEKRVVQTIKVPVTAMAKPALPSDNDLSVFHENNASRFTAPEYRSLVYVTLSIKDITDGMEISDEQVAAQYEEQIDSYRIQEKRDISQLILETQSQVDEATPMLGSGVTLQDIAAKVGGEVMEMGPTAAADLTLESSNAVFALNKGGVSQPVKSPLGWHVFAVNDIQPTTTTPLAEVKDQIIADMKGSQSVDALYTLSTQFEDILGGGATLEEAAQQLNLPLGSVEAIDSAGLDRKGSPVVDLPKDQNFISNAFSAEMGIDSELVETSAGYYILRVDTIHDPALRPMAEVRDEVVAMWQGNALKDAAMKKAEEMTASLNTGMSVANVAGKMAITTSEPFTKAESQNVGLPAGLADQVFKLERGKAANAPLGDDYVVAVLKDIQAADPSSDPEATASLENDLKGAMADDILKEMTQIFQARYGVDVNRASVEAQP